MIEPIIGDTYHIWRNFKYLGIATFSNDPNNGECFIDHSTNPPTVYFEVDEWELITE
jgi:hypothetical protein